MTIAWTTGGPDANSRVKIPCEWHMRIDVPVLEVNTLEIEGILEFDS